MECPDDNTLVAFAEGAIGSETRPVYARHLDTCSSCRETVVSIVRMREPASDGVDPALARTLASTPKLRAASEASAAPPSEGPVGPGAVVCGKYQVDSLVGEGGLGTVWSATHLLTRRRVALKITKFRLPELDKRFLREARVSGIVQHPNIVEVHDVLQLEGDGSLAMVMDLLTGESLDRTIASKGRLTLGETLSVMVPVLSALSAAHAAGIVHRDLKPHNIFLATAPEGTRPMLLDFGLAKMTATEGVAAMTSVLTREKQLLGTPHYMAPEQLYGELDIDARTDVWAVGTIFFECLTGERPLPGITVGQMLRSLAMREIPKVSSVVPGLPPDLAALVDGMLVRERGARVATIAPVLELGSSLLAAGVA